MVVLGFFFNNPSRLFQCKLTARVVSTPLLSVHHVQDESRLPSPLPSLPSNSTCRSMHVAGTTNEDGIKDAEEGSDSACLLPTKINYGTGRSWY